MSALNVLAENPGPPSLLESRVNWIEQIIKDIEDSHFDVVGQWPEIEKFLLSIKPMLPKNGDTFPGNDLTHWIIIYSQLSWLWDIDKFQPFLDLDENKERSELYHSVVATIERCRMKATFNHHP
jgi:hypothetical protein